MCWKVSKSVAKDSSLNVIIPSQAEAARRRDEDRRAQEERAEAERARERAAIAEAMKQTQESSRLAWDKLGDRRRIVFLGEKGFLSKWEEWGIRVGFVKASAKTNFALRANKRW